MKKLFQRNSATSRHSGAPLSTETTDGGDTGFGFVAPDDIATEIHRNIVKYVTATDETQQYQALTEIYIALGMNDANGDDGDEISSEGRGLVLEKDQNTLLSVSSQRLHMGLKKELDHHNAIHLSGHGAKRMLTISGDKMEMYVMMLTVIRVLLKDTAGAKVILIVSERLPSMLIKTLKALTPLPGMTKRSTAMDSNECAFVDAMLQLVRVIISYQDVIQELRESSTLHRIFHLKFNSQAQQLQTLSIIKNFTQSATSNIPNNWKEMAQHLAHHRCLLGLADGAIDVETYADIIFITALVLKKSFLAGSSVLHEQLESNSHYRKLFSLFVQISNSREEIFDTLLADPEQREQIKQQDNRIIEATYQLCLSGTTKKDIFGDISTDACYTLTADDTSPKEPASCFNLAAFELLCKIVDNLHRGAECEINAPDSRPQLCIASYREGLECRYVEQIGRILVQNRYDYYFISKTKIMGRIIERLDSYSEVAKHKIGSVLSAIAIEANIVPYTELLAISRFISQSSFTNSSITVLFVFLTNLLRFHDAYCDVLRSTGVVDSLLALFLTQAMALCSDIMATTKIDVEYPTSSMKIGVKNHIYSEAVRVDERNLVTLLTSHCRQTTRIRDSCQGIMQKREFLDLVGVLVLIAEGANTSIARESDGSYQKLFCNLPLLECICILIGNKEYQEHALNLWVAILHIAVMCKSQSTHVYNAVNCILQSMRYVTLAMYYRQDRDVSLVFPGDVNVLKFLLSCIEELVRPEELRADIPPRDTSISSFLPTNFSLGKGDRNRVLETLVACDGLYSCLAVLCALVKNVDQKNEHLTTEDTESTHSTVLLVIKMIHTLIISNTEVQEAFESSVTYAFYGDLIHAYLRDCQALDRNTVPSNATVVTSCCIRSLLGLAVDDYSLLYNGDICISDAKESVNNQIWRGICAHSPESNKIELRYPGAFALAVQLLSLWSKELGEEVVQLILDYCIAVTSSPANAQCLASTEVFEVMLRSFASTTPQMGTTYQSDSKLNRHLSQALLSESNAFHRQAILLANNVAVAGVTSREFGRWIKLIFYLSSIQSWKASESKSPRSIPTSSSKVLPSNTSPLLKQLAELACKMHEKYEGVPVIMFELSVEGFAYVQIPEVYVRGQLNAVTNQISSGPSSHSAFGHVSKTWPPPDGYSVMVWFRIDAMEQKEEREKQYRDCFMSNKCIICLGMNRDEHILKCSHRVCRGCYEALVNCGGECVICNPPMFYLFRFRSGDGKSVTEVFLKGAKLYMRTGSSRSVYQFTHSAIKPHAWYHAVFVHSKQRFQSSTISCYLNGIIQETVRMPYPSSMSSNQPLSGLIGVPSQARRLSSSKWALGSFYLLEEPLSALVINAIFAAGPSYDEVFVGACGNGETSITYDHLQVPNLVLLDEYMRDPIRSLIESVDAERVSRSSIIRGSLSLASAASSAAAAIVHGIKSNSNVFSRIPSAAPLVNLPLHQDRIAIAYTSRNTIGLDLSIVTNTNLDGRPIGQLIGGATPHNPGTVANIAYDLCSSGCRVAYIVLSVATTSTDVTLSLNLLWNLMRGHAPNLDAMEQEHGYGIVNYLLHQKASLLTKESLLELFRIAGIDIIEDNETAVQSPRAAVTTPICRDSSIRNFQALQYFILDYSLWQKVDTETQKLLFSSLYSCLVAGDDAIRERNRSQLQSLTIVRQLLHVFLDPNVENDLLRVIADLILVCLAGDGRDAALEANFLDVASFLVTTLSPRFWRSRGTGDRDAVAKTMEDKESERSDFSPGSHYYHSAEDPVSKLCLSPRGSKMKPWYFARKGIARFPSSEMHDEYRVNRIPFVNGDLAIETNARQWEVRQTKIQELLLDILTKAVQKHDLKENKDKDDMEGLMTPDISGSTSSGRANGVTSVPRIQLPTSNRLTGFRKILSPRWVGHFLFATFETGYSTVIAPSTVILALKLLCALLARPKYHAVSKKEGYYHLLAQGLPCNHEVFVRSGSDATHSFPFHELWYTLFCMLLGTPVDGIPHNINFEMFYLGKDFELNIQSDRILNPSILPVLLVLIRRHYHDPIAIARLQQAAPLKGFQSSQGEASLPQQIFQGNSGMYHMEVLDFIEHLYEQMPSFHKLLTTGNEKFRLEMIEELSLLICAATRVRVLERYSPTRKQIHQALLNGKKELSLYEYEICCIQLAEEAAAKDEQGEDPFLHAVAQRSLRILVNILINFLLDYPNGNDFVEIFFDGAFGVTMMPLLHEGLQLRFQQLVMLGLIDQIRVKFDDESILPDHKHFGANLRDFLKLAVLKMQAWQRAQHGDGCPPAFACCNKHHFAGGPYRLLCLALFILAETNVGIVGGGGFSTPLSSIGGLLNDKLSKGKKRRQLRQIMGRMNISRSVELEALTSGLYSTLNAVVLHMLHGHRVEVSDSELETMLVQIHMHRDVVLGPRNNQDKDFFVCLCRCLLQLLHDSNPSLQEAAAHLWIDLMYFQRAFIVDLLTVEIRRAGAPPYSVNLMKNGFEVLLECPSAATKPGAQLVAVTSPAFDKFKKWLELLGPPLKELEINLDRVFLKNVVSTKESIREGWLLYHKNDGLHKAKQQKRLANRYSWLDTMKKLNTESLIEAQRKEFGRQLKWRQDRIDRQNYIARQWQNVRANLLQQSLGLGLKEFDRTIAVNRALMQDIIESSKLPEQTIQWNWRLDFTEGPSRMRKRFLRIAQQSIRASISTPDPQMERKWHYQDKIVSSKLSAIFEYDLKLIGNRRMRRYSDGDILSFTREESRKNSCLWAAQHTHDRTRSQIHRAHLDEEKIRMRTPDADGGHAEIPVDEQTCRGSLGSFIKNYTSSLSSGKNSHAGERKRTSFSTNNDSGDENDDDDEDSGFGSFSGGSTFDEDAVDAKLRPLLVPGDEIMDIYDCLRVDGMDSCPGVFLLCSDHVYIVDNYQRLVQHHFSETLVAGVNEYNFGDGTSSQVRVVEVAKGATTRLERSLSLSPQVLRPLGAESFNSHTPCSSAPPTTTKISHECRFWSYEDIIELHKRRYQLRHVAIELFALDGRNYLITLESPQQRENVFHSLLNKCPNVRGAGSGMDRSAVAGDLYSQLRKLLRNSMTERWVQGELSNFEYLMHLNTLAGRSYNDLTQYPVFPWILSDYTSPEINLDDPGVYRDLSKPMGALHREEEFRARYEGLTESTDIDDPLSSKPFHYGTHYSSAGIVLHYLMRVEPFTSYLFRLQGGKFDHADRLFSSIQGAWKSAAGSDNAQNGTQDVKELIPEFFYFPAFLKNLNHNDFGSDQNGVKVDDVLLPPWAHGSANEFVRINREALESDCVSSQLHNWIDLIFGYKQQGAAAVEACNVFYHLTYEGAVDIDTIDDIEMKRAIVDQINDFGQTPSQLFKTSHPARVRGTFSNDNSISNPTGPSSFHSSQSGNSALFSFQSGSESAPNSNHTASLLTSRALASSFMEGSEMMISRMQTILSNTGIGGSPEDETSILEHAALLQQEPKREVALNPVVQAHRGHQYTSSTLSTKQRNSGNVTSSISQIALATGSVAREERIISVGEKCLLIPPKNHEFLAWGFQDRSLKIVSTGSVEGGSGDAKIITSFELNFEISVASISSDGRTVVTGGEACPVIRVWRYSAKKMAPTSGSTRRRAYTMGLHSSNTRSMTAVATLSTPHHYRAIMAVYVCRAYSIVVSGCAGGVVVLWDLNRMRYIRTLPSFALDGERHEGPVTSYPLVSGSSISSVAVNEVNGDIIASSGCLFGVYDVNGDLLTRLDYDTVRYQSHQITWSPITSIVLSRSERSEWSREKAVLTGHSDGVLCIWAYSQTEYGDDSWSLELKARHVVTKTMNSTTAADRSAITAVYMTSDERKVFTGNSDGLLSVWMPAVLPVALSSTMATGAT